MPVARSKVSLLDAEARLALGGEERRADALDSKAGLILGFSGVLAALSAHDAAIISIASLIAAGFSALTSLWALLPRPFPTLNVAELRSGQRYQRIHASFLELSVLDTRLDLLAGTRQILDQKAWRVRLAANALTIAVLLAAARPIVELIMEAT